MEKAAVPSILVTVMLLAIGAKQIGLTIPLSVLYRADRLIK